MLTEHLKVLNSSNAEGRRGILNGSREGGCGAVQEVSEVWEKTEGVCKQWLRGEKWVRLFLSLKSYRLKITDYFAAGLSGL